MLDTQHDKQPGTVLSTSPLVIACGEGALEIVAGQNDSGLYVQGSRLAQEMGIVTDVRLAAKPNAVMKRRTPRADPRG
ncbi:Polymyxin resistance protein PmrI [Serratia marcescens]|uniref:Polymyxin resistance protein PmrI n=1 Tax=Serratia marcescens TaxID=615 RepID=A0A379ZSK0_SERMA|nr:Polymyxin resistance protein PmrI [Serratia marcescens]